MLFLNEVNAKLLSKKVPAAVRESPLIVGQYLHDVVSDSCAIYMLICAEASSETAYIKIGMARNIGKRVAGIQSACPLRVQKVIYFLVPTDAAAYAMERAAHDHFAEYRIRGEWFMLPDKSTREAVVSGMMEWAEGYMAEDFNSWFFDPAATDECKEVRNFLAKLQAAHREKMGFPEDDPSSLLAEMAGSSEAHYERIARKMAQGFVIKMRPRP